MRISQLQQKMNQPHQIQINRTSYQHELHFQSGVGALAFKKKILRSQAAFTQKSQTESQNLYLNI